MNSGTSALKLTAVAKPRELARFDPRPRVRQAAVEQPLPRQGAVSGRPVREAVARPVASSQRARTAARPAMRLSATTVVMFVAAVFLMLMIVYSYMELSTLNSFGGKLSDELSVLQKEENVLRGQYDNSMDIAEIERYVTQDLGMIKPDASQITYVKLSGEDHAEVIERKTFWDYVGGLFSTVAVSVKSYLD